MKTALLSTLVVLLAAPSFAEGTGTTATLSPEVAQRVADLRKYGDRFEKAIRLIEAEAAKPTWGWVDCAHEGIAMVVLLPES